MERTDFTGKHEELLLRIPLFKDLSDKVQHSLLERLDCRWVLIIIFFEILIPPEPFMRDAPHFFYRKYNKNLL